MFQTHPTYTFPLTMNDITISMEGEEGDGELSSWVKSICAICSCLKKRRGNGCCFYPLVYCKMQKSWVMGGYLSFCWPLTAKHDMGTEWVGQRGGRLCAAKGTREGKGVATPPSPTTPQLWEGGVDGREPIWQEVRNHLYETIKPQLPEVSTVRKKG